MPCVPLSHPFVERLVTVRREYPGPYPLLDGRGSRIDAPRFQRYYNGRRAHAALDGCTPEPTTASRARANVKIVSVAVRCRGLYRTVIAA